ncbi:hypothetical protein ACNPM2_03720 [Stenotrophomonas geniculata]|nr:hypothetical protein [Stenotrophomonas sp. AS012628]
MTSHKTYIGSKSIYHICNARAAAEMIITGSYRSNKIGYDGGMNFCGVLGPVGNTWPRGRGARLHCKWEGLISVPLPYEAHDYSTPNVLYDFNGSGNHHQNNDPRWFLPYGSTVVITGLECEPERLEEYYLQRSGLIRSWKYRLASPQKRLDYLKSFHEFLNKQCGEGGKKLRIEKGDPTFSNGGDFFGRRLGGRNLSGI